MIVGIDLGTTNSLVAYFTEEGPKLIPNRLGKFLTPSVISVDEEKQVYVGETAKERQMIYPESSVSVFKRDMGTDKKFILQGDEYGAEDLSALILKSLKEDAEIFLGEEVTEAVISVPAYFNDQRRRATKRAGELAGFTVDRIISEPTAAAIAYGLYENDDNAKFLVFDLGGGTFDVSILERFDNIIEVRAVAGDNYLGGEDFTNVIEELFYSTHPEIDIEKITDKEKRHIHNRADHAKIALANENKAVMTCTIDGKEYAYTITESVFENACEELLVRIKKPIRKSLSDAGIRMRDISKVVLVGGATKHQIIRRFVAKLFGKLPDISINPDEAIALGAAVQAAMKERRSEIKEVILTDVCSFTLGTEVVMQDGDFMEGGHYLPIIERNTTIPASRTEDVYTVRDKQKKLRVSVLQGESRMANNNLLLGEIEIEVPEGPAGTEGASITYTYDVNGILEVIVKSLSTGEEVKEIFKGRDNMLTDEEIEERLKMLSYLKIPPREQEENKLLLLRGERMYEEALGEVRLWIDQALKDFDRALKTQDPTKIAEARGVLKEALDTIETYQ